MAPTIEMDLRRKLHDDLKRLRDIGSYRGRRHAQVWILESWVIDGWLVVVMVMVVMVVLDLVLVGKRVNCGWLTCGFIGFASEGTED